MSKPVKYPIQVINDIFYKQCGECKELKLLQNFGIDKKSVTGHNYLCKSCNVKRTSRAHKKTRYNLTDEQLDNMPSNCQICDKITKSLCIDHCHKTNKVRGILCDQCNFLIGLAYENTDTLAKAIKYLEFHK